MSDGGPGRFDWVQAAGRQIEADIKKAVQDAQQALQGKPPPTFAQVTHDRALLRLSGRYTTDEIGRMSDLEVVKAADTVRSGGFNPPDIVKAASDVVEQATGKGIPSTWNEWAAAGKAREVLDEINDRVRSDAVAQMKEALSRNSSFDPGDIDRMGLAQLQYEVRKEAERLSMGVENSREDPSAIAGRIIENDRRETRTQLVGLIESLGGEAWPRSAIEQLGDRDLTRIAAKLLTDLDRTGTGQQGSPSPGPGSPPGAGGTGSGGAGQGSGGTGSGAGGVAGSDPLLGGPGGGAGTGAGGDASGSSGGSSASSGAGGSSGAGTGTGGARGGTDAGAGAGEPPPPDDQGGWTYLGNDWSLDGETRVELWHDAQGNYVARTPDGKVTPVSGIVDSYGEPVRDGGSTVVTGGSGEGGQQTSGSDSTDDEDDDDAGSADDTASGSGPTGESKTGGVESTPVDDVDPKVRAIIDLGRGLGFHSGVQKAPVTSGDVDPVDPHSTAKEDLTGPIVDLQQRLLIGPRDPEIVGGRGSGRIPDTITAGGGVTDPTDERGMASGTPGREDDPFGALRPSLEPSADPGPDDPDDGPDTIGLPHLGLLRDLDPNPPGLAGRFGAIGFADLDPDD